MFTQCILCIIDLFLQYNYDFLVKALMQSQGQVAELQQKLAETEKQESETGGSQSSDEITLK